MRIYINKNNQQSGPFEDHVVIEQLRSGMLSPDDMGIRHGGTTWQRLSEMFPGVGSAGRATPSIPIPPPASVGGTSAAAAEPSPKKGGCLRGGLIGTGVLLLLLGIAVGAGSRFIPSTSCDLAESDKERIDKLQRDIDKAKSDFKYERVGPLMVELDAATAGYETSQKYCDDDKFRDNAIGISGGVLAFVGLLLAVIGLFIGRGSKK